MNVNDPSNRLKWGPLPGAFARIFSIRRNRAPRRVPAELPADRLAVKVKPALLRILTLSLLITGVDKSIAQADDSAKARERMVEQQIKARGIEDENVLKAMRSVPRHRMIPEKYRRNPYGDHPIPIGYGQTISQPYIVAFMTEALQVEPGDRILEVGTGSGYQAAVLAEITTNVFSIEIVPELAESADDTLSELGYDSVTVRQGDGYYGWKSEAPWDAIVVTAAAEHIPPPLVQQLKPGGRICIPVGSRFGMQYLLLVEKDPEGNTTTRNLMPVRFVPLTRKEDR